MAPAPTAPTPALSRLRAAGARLAASAIRRWFLDRQAEFWLAELGSTWSPYALRARVIEVVEETPDTKSFVLAPNNHWPGHRAGQYVTIEVEINGVRVRRCYSISSGASAPGDRITITVKRFAGGRVSTWLHDHLRPGAVIGLGRPTGDFIVRDVDAPLLLVAGGSGITPILGMLRDLAAHGTLHDVVVIQSAREDEDTIFGRELAAMATQHTGMRLIARRTGEHGRLDQSELRALVPDLDIRAIYVCGPTGLRELVVAVGGERVVTETFATPRLHGRPRGGTTAKVIELGDRRVAVSGTGTVLEQLERAGERPEHGCRIGVCHTCKCIKQRGTVLDLTTGRVSSEPDEEIRLCVSFAQGDLQLDRLP